MIEGECAHILWFRKRTSDSLRLLNEAVDALRIVFFIPPGLAGSCMRKWLSPQVQVLQGRQIGDVLTE